MGGLDCWLDLIFFMLESGMGFRAIRLLKSYRGADGAVAIVVSKIVRNMTVICNLLNLLVTGYTIFTLTLKNLRVAINLSIRLYFMSTFYLAITLTGININSGITLIILIKTTPITIILIILAYIFIKIICILFLNNFLATTF